MGWAGHVARMEEGRSAFKLLTGKPTVAFGKYLKRSGNTIRTYVSYL